MIYTYIYIRMYTLYIYMYVIYAGISNFAAWIWWFQLPFRVKSHVCDSGRSWIFSSMTSPIFRRRRWWKLLALKICTAQAMMTSTPTTKMRWMRPELLCIWCRQISMQHMWKHEKCWVMFDLQKKNRRKKLCESICDSMHVFVGPQAEKNGWTGKDGCGVSLKPVQKDGSRHPAIQRFAQFGLRVKMHQLSPGSILSWCGRDQVTRWCPKSWAIWRFPVKHHLIYMDLYGGFLKWVPIGFILVLRPCHDQGRPGETRGKMERCSAGCSMKPSLIQWVIQFIQWI